MLLNLWEILEPVVRDDFTVGGFNVTGSIIFRVTVEEAQYREAPAIIQTSPNGFQFSEWELYPYFSVRLRRSKNPFALHYGYSKSYEGCIHTIQAGFTSVMFDGPQMEYDQNVECTRRIVETAHGVGISVGGKIGIIEETKGYLSGTVQDVVYTSPELAGRFVEDTGVGALVVSIGAIHGILPRRCVSKLQLGFLKELAAAVPVPLVLHGGSDAPHDEITAVCRASTHKVNIFSGFEHTYYQGVREFVANHPALVGPTRVLKDAVQEAGSIAGIKMQVLDNTGRLHCYREY